MHDYGTVLLTVADRDKEEAVELAKRFNRIGFTIMATKGTASTLEEANIPVSQVKNRRKPRNVDRLYSKWPSNARSEHINDW